MKTTRRLDHECEEILRRVMSINHCLQPDNPNFDVWDSADAKKIVADLIIEIKASAEIEEAHARFDWGK